MRKGESRRRSGGAAAAVAAGCLLAGLALASCRGGGADGQALEEGTAVNPVEAMLAIDDVRVAGVPLAAAPPSATPLLLARAAAPEPESGTATNQGRDEVGADGGAASRARAEPAAAATAAPGNEPRPGHARQRPLARVAVGQRLVVDMEVADAPAGSEVSVLWWRPDGRLAWRQKQPVGDEPRLAFAADTAGWPAGVYRGEVRYGRETLHRFAVQVGAPTVVAGRAAGPGDPGGTATSAQPASPATVGEGLAAAAPEAARPPAAPAGETARTPATATPGRPAAPSPSPPSEPAAAESPRGIPAPTPPAEPPPDPEPDVAPAPAAPDPPPPPPRDEPAAPPEPPPDDADDDPPAAAWA